MKNHPTPPKWVLSGGDYAAFRASIAPELAANRPPSRDWDDLSCSSLERGKGKRGEQKRPVETRPRERKRKKSKYE